MSQKQTDPISASSKQHQGKLKTRNIIQIFDVAAEDDSHEKGNANQWIESADKKTGKQNVPGQNKKNKVRDQIEILKMVKIVGKKKFWQAYVPGEEALRERKIKYLVQFSDGTRVYKTTNELRQFYSEIADFEQNGSKNKRIRSTRGSQQRLEAKKRSQNKNHSAELKGIQKKMGMEALMEDQNRRQQINKDDDGQAPTQQVRRLEKPRKKNGKGEGRNFQIVLQRLQKEVGQIEYCSKPNEERTQKQQYCKQNKNDYHQKNVFMVDDCLSISSEDQKEESLKRKRQSPKIHQLSGRSMINQMHINRKIFTEPHLSRQNAFFQVSGSPLFSMHSYVLPPKEHGEQEKMYIKKVCDLRIKNEVIEIKIEWRQQGISQTWLDLNVAKMLDKQMIVETFIQEYMKCCLHQTSSKSNLDVNSENYEKQLVKNKTLMADKNRNSKSHWKITT